MGIGDWGLGIGDWGLGTGELSLIILRVPASPRLPHPPHSPHPSTPHSLIPSDNLHTFCTDDAPM
ncbi:MAG: hypothetical protein KME21_23760 [Desmonostoc vinosum HA7617-LM4]|nr:hypothetical protein [Desmonostoc vinosum HA7617-LM4]